MTLVEPCEPRRMLSFSVSVNFQPAASPVPAGYVADSGQAFGARGNGYSYGWNADNSANVRDRASGVADHRLDTLAMMQPDGAGAFSWEIAVPAPGTYRVHVVSGDPAFPTATVRINAYGQSVINRSTDPLHPWVDGWAYVSVNDGRLTLSPGASAFNTKIDSVEITDNLNAPITPLAFPSTSHDITIGTNLDGLADYSSISPFIDLATQFRKWAPVDTPWKPNLDNPIPVTSDNYPTTDAGAITFATGYPSGVYQVSYKGGGNVAFARYHKVGDENLKIEDLPFTITSQSDLQTTGTITLDIPDKVEDWYFALIITNIDPNNPIHDLHIISPDADPNVSPVFRPVFLQKLAAFDGPIRVMDWMATNGSTVHNWTDRTPLTRFSYTGPAGLPYETWIALANALHKDLWINIPHAATDLYLQNLANLLRDQLDPSLKVYLEYSNEVWNSSSVQGQYLFNKAATDSQLTATDPILRAAQELARQLVRVDFWFQNSFGARYATQIRPMLGGFIANSAWAQAALDYIKAKYGEPKGYVTGVAVAPYVGNESDMAAINNADLTLDTLFAWMNNWIDTTTDQWLKAHKRITDQYEVALESYEGGQHLQALLFPDNEPVKRAAQDDPRMADVYRHLIAKWVADGGDIFSNFSLAAKYSEFGYWGLLQAINQDDSVKYSTMKALAATTLKFFSAPESIVPAAPKAAPAIPSLAPIKRPPFARKRMARVFD
jgi:hypothetical protein